MQMSAGMPFTMRICLSLLFTCLKASFRAAICAPPPVNIIPEVSLSLSSSIWAQTLWRISSYLASMISQRRPSFVSLPWDNFRILLCAPS